MTELQLTFTDLDENALRVTLKQDRVQLSVVDSHPELEGAELRAFASALFARYVGADLLDQLRAARIQLIEARDRPPQEARSPALVTAVEHALRALDDVTRLMTSGQPPAPPAASGTAMPPPANPTPVLYLTPLGRRPRTSRAQEAGPEAAYSRCSYA